jgi:N,N'-diacetyllegionaminate synthase
VKSFKIGTANIGNKYRSFIIAEIGVNHNGKISIAKKMIDAAIKCGADCVKFQTFKSEDLANKKTGLAKYQVKNKVKDQNQLDMLKRLELSKNDFVHLYEYCKKKKIQFLSTPFNKEDVDFLKKLGVKAFKLSSMHAVEYEFIRYVASKKLPMIVSTGMCTMNEVTKMIKTIRNRGNNKICVLQCNSNYPAYLKDSHINVLKSYERMNLITGYSDHTINDISAILALGLGAKVFEKHFTLDKKMIGPDHLSSLNPSELKNYISNIRLAESALGSEIKKPTKNEKNTMFFARRSLVTKNEIYKGKKISINDLKFMRPYNGIGVKDLKKVLNKKVKKNLKKNELIQWKDLQK